jgi:hypothetical protein
MTDAPIAAFELHHVAWPSRRGVLVTAAAATAFLGLRAASAQADLWREYRRDDVGFRIEFPGEPQVEDKPGNSNDDWIRSVQAVVEYERMAFTVECGEFTQSVSAEAKFEQYREAVRFFRFSITRDIALSANRVPTREFAIDFGRSGATQVIIRLIAAGHWMISNSVTGDRSMHSSAAVARFLNSFALLTR